MWARRGAAIALCAVLCGNLAGSPPPATAADPGASLRAGAGRADITPPTGYYLMGWVRSDARAEGQLTRLFARALVIQKGARKVALVAADLAYVPAGLVADVAERLRDRGFGRDNIVVSASHTHSGPAGYGNYTAVNFIAPTTATPTEFDLGQAPDERLYTFLVSQVARAIARADRDRAPAAAGWGNTKLYGVTENRSTEAHLGNHGIALDYGSGYPGLDPFGARHTIDPDVDVLRIDKLGGGRHVPIGLWSTFANHGTVVKPDFTYYNADHHAAAARIAEARIRRLGDVPRDQEVVNAYGNSDQGDMTAGLRFSGPAGAHEVGMREARAFLRAWKEAGRRMSRRIELNRRWTVECFCGRETAIGPVDDHAVVGVPFVTGTEENRGPLFDITGIPFEGYRAPTGSGPQGVKLPAFSDLGPTFPEATPLTTVRVADRAIVTVPGEMTSGMGRRLKDSAEAAVRGSGIREVVISGLANDYIQYVTTPEEYDRQHFEGGTTLFGRATGIFIQERLVALLERLLAGEPAPEPDPDDPRNGLTDDEPPFPPGAASAVALEQPAGVERLDHATFAWQGGPRGEDRPLDRAFVTIQRRDGGRWRAVEDDLGLRILWSVDADGRYRAVWEPAVNAPLGSYRFLITANRYRLGSERFAVRPASDLEPRILPRRGAEPTSIDLLYPEAIENRDLAWRPAFARGVHRTPTGEFHDRYGNRAGD
jgi:neutral ceramidase